MKNILLFVMSLASVLPLAAKPHGDAVGRELFRLDSLIAQKPSLEAMKEQRIDRLRQQRKRHMTAEQEFMLNELFHKEFSIYERNSPSMTLIRPSGTSTATSSLRTAWDGESARYPIR